MVAMYGEQKNIRGELNIIRDEQTEAANATDTLAERMNLFGEQLKQETCNREHAMNCMEARWQASQAQFGKNLEERMEQRLKAAMGDLIKGAPINGEEDERHRTDVFLSKLTPEPKRSMLARIKQWLERASIQYKDVKMLRETQHSRSYVFGQRAKGCSLATNDREY